MFEEQKKSIITRFKLSENDTGSAEVQVALLTNRINQLTEHLKVNKKDFQSRRTLLILVGQRRRMLVYLSKHNLQRYTNLIQKLGLRK